MLGNNASYEDPFITCQITPDDHGSLLDSLVNMQLASRNPFPRQIVADQVIFSRFAEPPPPKCTLTSVSSFAELSRNFPENIPIRKPQQSAVSWNLVFPELSCRVWNENSKATSRTTSRRCKDAHQDHGVSLWQSLTLEARLPPMEGIERKGECPKPPKGKWTELNQN